MLQKCPTDSVCFLEVRRREGVFERMCTGCQQTEACYNNKMNNSNQCKTKIGHRGPSVCRDCCNEGEECGKTFNGEHPMIGQFIPEHNPNGKNCDPIYTPNNRPYFHGTIWGHGLCPSYGTNPGGPLHEFKCDNGVVTYKPTCTPKYLTQSQNCINGAPHGKMYTVGTCAPTGGPLSVWTCENGLLTYSNPCYEAVMNNHTYIDEEHSSSAMGEEHKNAEGPRVLAVDSDYGVYLSTGYYWSKSHSKYHWREDQLVTLMVDAGHWYWIAHGFPDFPIVKIDQNNLIIFDDGISMNQDQHKMTTQELERLKQSIK